MNSGVAPSLSASISSFGPGVDRLALDGLCRRLATCGPRRGRHASAAYRRQSGRASRPSGALAWLVILAASVPRAPTDVGLFWDQSKTKVAESAVCVRHRRPRRPPRKSGRRRARHVPIQENRYSVRRNSNRLRIGKSPIVPCQHLCSSPFDFPSPVAPRPVSFAPALYPAGTSALPPHPTVIVQ